MPKNLAVAAAPPQEQPPEGAAPDPSPQAPARKPLLFVSFMCALLLLAAAAILAGVAATGATVWAPAFGCAALGLALLLLHGLDSGDAGVGFFRPLIGADGRFSTSLTQLGIWTVAAGGAFAYLLGRVMFESKDLDEVLPGGTWDEYLLLLGGPFAAAVLAKGIVTYKLDAGTLQKTEADRPEAGQVATTDQGNVDLVDSQYLLFNVIAMGYFVVELVRDAVLPAMPGPLLAMTSATAGLYVANKAAQRNAPFITSVSPARAGAGQSVTVLGMNFDPADRDDTDRRVTVALSGSSRTLYSTKTSDTKILFEVPGDAQPGRQTFAVTSTAGAQTEARDIEIVSADILIIGLVGDEPLRPGERSELRGARLGGTGGPLKVVVGSVPVTANLTPGQAGTEDRLAFDVPVFLPEATDPTVAVSVTAGQQTASATLPLDQPRVRSAWRLPDGAVSVAATGWHGRDLSAARSPQVLVDGRPAALRAGWRENPASPLLADPPPGADPSAEARVAVVDDLGRRSADYLLPGAPPV